MKKVYGNCKFCGQTRALEVPDKYDELDIEHEATINCYCEEAKSWHFKLDEAERREQSLLSAKAMIIELFQQDFPEVAKILEDSIEPLSDFRFDKISIKADDTTTATISVTSKGEIKVQRTDKVNHIRVSSR